jgi:hypothetical protein
MASQITMTPAQLATNWQNGLTNAVQKIKDGISRVTDSPMAKAAASQDKWVAGITKAAQSGRWANSLNAVDLNTWKTVTAQKVGERLSGGATAAVPKVTKFATWLIPAVNAASAQVATMPKLTLQDSINRAAAFMTAMAANPYKG